MSTTKSDHEVHYQENKLAVLLDSCHGAVKLAILLDSCHGAVKGIICLYSNKLYQKSCL